MDYSYNHYMARQTFQEKQFRAGLLGDNFTGFVPLATKSL